MEVDHEDDEWHLPSLEELFRSSAVCLNCVPPPPKLAARRQVWTVQFFLHVNMRAGHNGDLFLAENRQRPQGRMASCFLFRIQIASRAVGMVIGTMYMPHVKLATL